MYEIGLCSLLSSQVISEYFLAITTNREKCSIALGVKKTLEITLSETEEFHLAICPTEKKHLLLDLLEESGCKKRIYASIK